MEIWREVDVPGKGKWQVRPAVEAKAIARSEAPKFIWKTVPWRIRQRKQKSSFSSVIQLDEWNQRIYTAIHKRWPTVHDWILDRHAPQEDDILLK